MLEKLDLKLSLAKEEYKARLPVLQERLFELQTSCWKNGVPGILVFEGWDTAGVGSCLNLITSKLEPRGFRLYATRAARTYETHMPWLWRYWQRVPNYGQLAMFDKSWYRRVLDERVERLTPGREWRKSYQDILDFERTLADDGYLIQKFFFHITKREQKKRFEKSERDPLTAWHISDEQWARHKKYKNYLAAVEDMLAKTDSEWAPWTIVEAMDRRWARIKTFEAIASALDAGLSRRGINAPAGGAPAPRKKRS
jgi:polyphosphate kinase 2 (PPK2 family)